MGSYPLALPAVLDPHFHSFSVSFGSEAALGERFAKKRRPPLAQNEAMLKTEDCKDFYEELQGRNTGLFASPKGGEVGLPDLGDAGEGWHAL